MTTLREISEEIEAKILRQVEFYFSDSNLPRDKFLLRTIEESEDGLVNLPLVCSFSRMRSYLGLKEHGADKVPPEAVSTVAEILRKSSELCISDDGLRVGRTKKLLKPEEVQSEVDSRSIAASPMPWNTTIEQVESFFSQVAKVKSVRLHRHSGTKVFSGVAIVELASEEEAHKVLEMKLVFEGAELELQHKNEFYEKLQSDLPPQNEAHDLNAGGELRMAGCKIERMKEKEGFPKGLIVTFKLEKMSSSVGEREGESNGAAASEESAGKEPQETDKKVSDVEDFITREDIKDVLSKYGVIKFIDFSRGDTSGFIRFELPEGAVKARAAAVLASEGGLVIKSFLATLEAVEGEAEDAYWKKLRDGQNRKRVGGGRGFGSHRRGRGQHGFGRDGGRGRAHEHSATDDQAGGDTVELPHGKHLRFEEHDESEVPSKVPRIEQPAA